MKVAVVYNRISKRVINLFGTPNREKYGLKSIARITNGLREGGHQVLALEGDRDLIDRLEEFMPRVLKGERPGLVFNLSYGIQGEARYTHVPGMLEMAGVPYVGSGPLAHSLALDKVVAKMLFRQNGLPTPDFVVLDTPDDPIGDLEFPLIVKPRNEAVSFGLTVVHDEADLREAAGKIYERFAQPVLVEQFIQGREVNVGLIGNGPPEALPPAELVFGEEGPQIYTYEDKTGSSGRSVHVECPAPLGPELTERAQELARKAFACLRCVDCARVDMRLDAEGNLYILEINSLPSLGEHGSFVAGAEAIGLDFAALVNRLVDEASARYFGTPTPPVGSSEGDAQDRVLGFLVARRDRMEKSLREWVNVSSRTDDALGVRAAARRIGKTLEDVGLRPLDDDGKGRWHWTYETPAGADGGTLLVAALDVPLDASVPHLPFRRDPEAISGEGVASSRGALVMIEYALRALRRQRAVRRMPLGVFLYADDGLENVHSAPKLRDLSARAGRVLVLRPGLGGGKVVHRRRGQRRYELVVEGEPRALGKRKGSGRVFEWFSERILELADLSDPKRRIAVAATDVRTRGFPQLPPHRIEAQLVLAYPDVSVADQIERRVLEIFGQSGPEWSLDLLSDRPPLKDSKPTRSLLAELGEIASRWDVPFEVEGSVWPSPAGLVPKETPVVCGFGPIGHDVFTPREGIDRFSLVQRTLLLAAYLADLDARR